LSRPGPNDDDPAANPIDLQGASIAADGCDRYSLTDRILRGCA